MTAKIRDYILTGHIMIILFILSIASSAVRVYSGSGLPRELPAGCKNSCLYGFAYKAVWNKDRQALFMTSDGYNVLLYFNEKCGDTYGRLSSGAYIKLDTEAVSVSVPEHASNFGGFDSKQYLASKNVIYTAYVNSDKYIDIYGSLSEMKRGGDSLKAGSYFTLKTSYKKLCAAIRGSIQKSAESAMGTEYAGFVMGILTGTTDGIQDESMENYRNAGIAHVMAVSGMHMGFVQGISMRLFSRKRIHISVRCFLCIVCLILFAGIADYSASVTRALIQNVYILTGKLFRRPCRNHNALMLAASVQLVMNPYNIYGSGFILSYAAAASILLICPVISKHIFFFGKIPSSLSSGISVSIGMSPLLIQYFNTLSPIGTAATVFASGLAYCICMSGLMIWVMTYIPIVRYLRVIPASFASAAIYGLDKVSCIGSGVPPPLGAFKVPSFPAYIMIIYYSALLLFLYGKNIFRRKIKAFSVVFISCAVIFAGLAGLDRRKSKTEVIFLDVGQGFSAVVKIGGVCGLVDAGDGKTDVSSLLFRQGIGTLDFLMLTHGHDDHSGGIYDVMSEHNIKCVIVPDNPYDSKINEICDIAHVKGIEVMRVKGEKKYAFGTAEAVLYANESSMISDESSDVNNSSLTAYMYDRHGSVIFTGDIEIETETYIADAGYARNTDILAVAHHGSDTSSKAKNISIISPEYAIISVGRNNSYGHPSDRVINTLTESGANIMRTDICGAVRVVMREGKLRIWQKLTA